MNKYKVDIYRVVETEWNTDKDFCRTEYTEAVSEAQACNNVRYRMKKEYGWRDHDEKHGSVSVKYEYVATLEEGHGFEQLRLF